MPLLWQRIVANVLPTSLQHGVVRGRELPFKRRLWVQTPRAAEAPYPCTLSKHHVECTGQLGHFTKADDVVLASATME